LPAAMISTAIAYLVSGDNTIFRAQVPTRKDSPAHAGEYSTTVLTAIKAGDAGWSRVSWSELMKWLA